MELYKKIEENVTSDFAHIYLYQQTNKYIFKDWIHRIEGSGTLNPMDGFYHYEKWQ